MRRPNVTVENHEHVYEWYRHNGQKPWFAKLGHRVVAGIHKPQLSADPSAGRLINSLLATQTRLVLVGNHIDFRDVTVLPAAMWAYKPLKPVVGNGRIVAKEETFNGEVMNEIVGPEVHPLVKKVGGKAVRVICDSLGQIPALRKSSNQDADSELIKDAHRNLAATEGYFLGRGIHIAKFGEGARNKEQPETVQAIKPGVRYGLEAVSEGVHVAVVPVGIWYPSEGHVRVHVGEPIVSPLSRPDVLGDVRDRLQDSVDVARGVIAA